MLTRTNDHRSWVLEPGADQSKALRGDDPRAQGSGATSDGAHHAPRCCCSGPTQRDASPSSTVRSRWPIERYRSPADASELRAARSPSRLSLLLGERTFASSGNHECETAGHRGRLQRQRRDAHLRALRRPARSECAEMRSCRGGEPDESFRSGTSRPRSCARATTRAADDPGAGSAPDPTIASA